MNTDYRGKRREKWGEVEEGMGGLMMGKKIKSKFLKICINHICRCLAELVQDQGLYGNFFTPWTRIVLLTKTWCWQ